MEPGKAGIIPEAPFTREDKVRLHVANKADEAMASEKLSRDDQKQYDRHSCPHSVQRYVLDDNSSSSTA